MDEEKGWKPNVINFAKAYVKDLKPRAITRDSDWGIPVPLPGAEGKVLYVWFDAPIGYISATKEWAEKKNDSDLWKKYWLDERTKLVQFIGKDNIPFHAVFFPAMTMGQIPPYKLVDELPANEFYNLEGRQFSKSDGWYIDLESFFKKFSVDQIRYAIAATAPESQDSEFSWKDFQMHCNAELVGKFGNFINRVLVFAFDRCQGAIPRMDNIQEVDEDFIKKCRSLVEECREAYQSFHLRRACQIIMELSGVGNVYFDAKRPWKAAKDPSLTSDMKNTIRACLECAKLLALISAPVMPATSAKVWELLGYKIPFGDQTWDQMLQMPLDDEMKLPKPQILFNKVEDDVIDEEIAKLQAQISKLGHK